MSEHDEDVSATGVAIPVVRTQPKPAGDDSDSDLSDLSNLSSDEEDDEGPQEKAPSPGSELDDGAKEDDKDEDYGSGPASHMFSPEAQDDENEDKDGEYTAAPKRRRRSPVEGDDDEDADADADADDEDASPRAKKAKEIRKQKQESKARVRKEEVFENEAPVDEATARKRALDARMEAIGKATKRRRVRKSKDDADDLGVDEIVQSLAEDMRRAISRDQESNLNKQPAMEKTRILPRVQAAMQNATMQQAILDNSEFLSTVREYIEPLKDGSLPSLNVQKAIMDQLAKLDGLDTNTLRESGLGRIINFYTRYKRVHPDIARQANRLIDKWSKPIINQNVARPHAAAGDDDDEEDDIDLDRGEDESGSRQSIKRESLLKKKVDERHKASNQSKSTRLPNIIGHAYTVAPAALRKAKSAEDQQNDEQRIREQEKLNRFKRKALLANVGR